MSREHAKLAYGACHLQQCTVNMNFRCWAYVGRTTQTEQALSLGTPGCVSKGIALHELMHTLGFWHEQSRSDRDKYVKVKDHNIKEGKCINPS